VFVQHAPVKPSTDQIRSCYGNDSEAGSKFKVCAKGNVYVKQWVDDELTCQAHDEASTDVRDGL
jgi:hypothetical protein